MPLGDVILSGGEAGAKDLTTACRADVACESRISCRHHIRARMPLETHMLS
jgi:hypothetical protein